MLLPFCNKLFLEVQRVHMFFRVVTAITCYTHLLMGFLSDLQQPINVDKLECLRSEVDGFLCRKNLYCSHLLCIIKSTVSSHVVFLCGNYSLLFKFQLNLDLLYNQLQVLMSIPLPKNIHVCVCKYYACVACVLPSNSTDFTDHQYQVRLSAQAHRAPACICN